MVALLLSAAPIARAQQNADQKGAEQRIKDEKARLEALKNEREELQRRRTSLQNTVHDLSEEVETLDREADVTARVMHSLDAQLEAISSEVGSTTSDLVRAQDEITVKQATMRRRLVDIDKRGPLFSFEVLLSARSFGELLARYKYLHLLAVRDQTLVHRVEDLRNQINHQRANLVRFQESIKLNLDEKAEEEDRLRTLRLEQTRSLAQAKRRAQATDARLQAISRDESRLSNVIANLESARLRAERTTPGVSRAPSTIRKGTGSMDWPVQGEILYSFGRVVNPNNTTVRWNGIGIKAASGTEVHAVAAGKVLVADQFGTYGLTVIVQHPGGDYSVYGSLSKITTQKGAVVTKGQVIGLVGTADPDLPAHLHFELRPQGHAVDPMDILRPTQ
ncbi:MAG TPA: peptidoglycan DD-metalloendopeptidase family protein [Gemmatimonadaceae bacterium]|nr:peptidoglycan DD-metalloendopeptidase family protein [Gemmatimonadaceae bacterium]